MLLEAIIKYIRQQIPLSARHGSLQLVLNHIKCLILESEGGKHKEKIREALLYIELMHVKPFLKEEKLFGQIISADGYPAFQDVEAYHQIKQRKTFIPQTSLSSDERHILGSIHVSLMEEYKKQTWYYTYPVISGQVINDVITEWQTSQRILCTTTDKAFDDFKRDTCIMNICGGEDKDIVARINTLVDSARGYPKKQDKELLKTWLRQNGGQTNNFFINDSFMMGHFTNDEPGNGPHIGWAKYLTQNWDVAYDKIILDYDVGVQTLNYDSTRTIMKNSHGQTVIVDPNDAEADLKLFKSSKRQIPLLMRVKTRIQLDIVNGVVVPKIIKLETACYNNLLLSPKRLFQASDSKQNTNHTPLNSPEPTPVMSN